MLVMVMVFNSIPYQPVSANDIDNAIGIFNNVMTSQSGLTSDFKITFYKLKADPVPGTADDPQYTYTYEPVTLADEFQLEDTKGKIVYLEKDGKIRLEQGHSVLFNSDRNIALKNYLISNEIRRIKISLNCNELQNGQEVKVYEQYATTLEPSTGTLGAYSEYDNDTSNPPKDDPAKAENAGMMYLLDYEGSTQKAIKEEDHYSVMKFNSTPLIDFDVDVLWRDTNAERPNNSTIQFDVSRKTAEDEKFENYTKKAGTPSVVQLDSNNTEFTFRVPERSEQDKPYEYKAEEKNVPNYSVLQTDNSHFQNFSLKSFSCTVNWNDIAHANDLEKNISAEFIRTHFDLLDETDASHPHNIFTYTVEQLKLNDLSDEDKAYVESVYEKVRDEHGKVVSYKMPDDFFEYDKDSHQLKISKLYEITANGTAKIYSIKPKNSSIPVNEVGTPSASYTDYENDSYLVSSVNTGVRSNIVDKTYDGGELNLLLTGDTEFKGNLNWADEDKKTEREAALANGTAGNFILYRYVDPEMVSQVGTWNINTGNQYLYAYLGDDGKIHSNIPKYDNTGAAYFYFAKERLSSNMGEYGVEYVFSGENHSPFNGSSGSYNGAAVFPNGATVNNALTGYVFYSLNAEWIAAELQGGTGELHYKLQSFNKTTGQWEDVEGDPVTDSENITRYPGKLDLLNFSAEMMAQAGAFLPVRKYDKNGNLNQYRIVQTVAQRTDNGSTASYTTPFVTMACTETGELLTAESVGGKTRIKLEGEENGRVRIKIGNNQFDVQAFRRDNGVIDYTYRLVGEVEAVLNKDWSNVPIDLIENAWSSSVTLQVKVFNYKTGNYDNFDEAHGNPGNLLYTDGTKDGSDQLIQYSTGENKSGQLPSPETPLPK